MHAGGRASLAFYQPRETIAGGDAAPLPRATPDEVGIEPGALAAAVRYAGARNTHALLVTRHGELVLEQYWSDTNFATLENADAFAETLAALMTGIALAEHAIHSLDEPAANYLREWQGDTRRSITVHQLLQMSSGLEPRDASSLPWSAAMHEYLARDLTSQVLARRLTGRPGATFAHQAVDAQLLALIVQRAAGMRYAQYISRKLWQPIGAGEAYVWLDREGGLAHADCCLLARQGDWLRVGELLLSDGMYQGQQVLPRGWVRQMLTPADGNAGFGYQMRLGSPFTAQRPARRDRRQFASRALEPYAANDVFLLESSGTMRLWLVPSLALAVLRTGEDPPPALGWDEATIPNLIIRGVRDRPSVRPSAAAGVDLSKLVPAH
jgi:CubicO group peptidase (beta-lactamase class C family)